MSLTPPPSLPPSSHLHRRPTDVVSSTSSIARLARRGHLAASAAEFSSMLSSSSPPNHITFITLLSACCDFPSSPFAFPLGVSLHSLALKLSLFSSPHSLLFLTTNLINFYFNSGLPLLAHQMFDRIPQPNSFTYNTMIAGHMKNSQLHEALAIFRRMPVRDLISWTAIIDGCAKNGEAEQALEYFRQMMADKIDPDHVTVIAVATACSDIGTLALGLWLHRFAMKREFILKNVRVGNALINMYSKCGRVDFAQKVFDEMPEKTPVSWNSMIMGLAINGRSAEALLLFSAMRGSEIKPNSVSFTAALTACSHAGLINDGLHLFQLMGKTYGIVAREEHYGCLVDMFARAGRLEEAVDVVERMPMRPNEVTLGSVMAACRDVRLGERLMGVLLEIEGENESNYVLMSNIYAAMGNWEGVGKVRNLMKEMGVKKKPGYSAVEIECVFYEFVAGDRSYVETEEIYDLLDLIHFDLEFNGYEEVVDEDFLQGYID